VEREGEIGRLKGAAVRGVPLSSTAAPEALAGVRAQPDEDITRRLLLGSSRPLQAATSYPLERSGGAPGP